MSDTRTSVAEVLAGIDAAAAAGLAPIKVNTVVRRGVNDGDNFAGLLRLAEHFRERGHTVRFIEYMDVGATNNWRSDQVVPTTQLVAEQVQRARRRRVLLIASVIYQPYQFFVAAPLLLKDGAETVEPLRNRANRALSLLLMSCGPPAPTTGEPANLNPGPGRPSN